MRTVPRLVSYCAVFALSANIAACKTGGGSELRSQDADGMTASTPASSAAPRLEADSSWHYVGQDDVDLHQSYSAWLPAMGSATEGDRVRRLEIGKKAIAMVDGAKTTIVASAFLFDSMYALNPEGMPREINSEEVAEERRITEVFRDKLIEKKRQNPNMLIVVVLDPINRAYEDRVSEAVKRFGEAGIDVFYSDLASTPPVGKNNTAMAAFQELHRRDVHVEDLQNDAFEAIEKAVNNAQALSPLLGSRVIKIKEQLDALKQGKPLVINGQPLMIDGKPFTLDLAFNIALLKANHRKLLVTDVGGDYEALVSSANPHNASFGAANSALSVKGSLARYVYDVIREDVKFSIERQKKVEAKYADRPDVAKRYGKRFVVWSKDRADEASRADYLDSVFPALGTGEPSKQSAETPVAARFVTESKIADAVLEMLRDVQSGDEVRIQMFYLSYEPIIEAIIAAKDKGAKVRLILDPNKDAFNNIKDGTPNRQVARYMLTKMPKDDLRWYSTHGEQNHAKIMSVTNESTGKYEVVTGSCNWTGKNIAGPNMESNLVLKGAEKATKKFNEQFDTFWMNREDSDREVEYTIAYDDERYRYHEQTADDAKWRKGEETGLVAW